MIKHIKQKNLWALLTFSFLFLIAHFNPVSASLLNIDFGNATGSPPSSFEAASEQSGSWNTIISLGTTTGLIDLDGNSTSVSITVSAGAINGSASIGSDNMNKLMGDNFYKAANNAWTVTLNNLNNGIYDVYLYDPYASNVSTGAGSVNGITFTDINGNRNGGVFAEGVNYHLLSGVAVTDGTLVATGTSSVSGDYGGLSGLQITPSAVPIPGAAWLLGGGLVCLVGIRRKFNK
jgi:hypothetical protein